MTLTARKLVEYAEEIREEGGREVRPPARVVAVAAVIANPWAGRGFVEDLGPVVEQVASPLGALLVPRLTALLGAPVEAYGKAAVVGLEGELEHGSALIHTLAFGNHLREAASASTLLPAVEKRAAAGATFDVPLKHVTDATIRSHHQTFEVRVPDAPRAHEIVVALAAAATGRPHARLAPFPADGGSAAGRSS